MQIVYSQNNNLCFGDSNGSIRISQVLFTPAEEDSYISYTIDWSDNIPTSKISADGSLVSFLSNGTYTFRIVSLSSNATSNLYSINIVSPNSLEIINVSHSRYSCSSDGKIIVEITGGQSPYVFFANGNVISSSTNIVTFDELPPDQYTIRVIDNNGCSDTWTENIIINRSDIVLNNIAVLPPEIYDGAGSITFDIIGNGPFGLFFKHTQDESKNTIVDLYNTDYIYSIDTTNNIYSYKLPDMLYPGTYELTIKNQYNCYIITQISIPNINPISVSINANSNTTDKIVTIINTEPIFDTILVPYKNIIENTIVWQTIKKYNLKDKITIKINDILYQYPIVRHMADKYCLNNNQIEILKLSNKSDDWYYYFYIAPSINLSTDPDLMNASISLVVDDTEFPITLGLSTDGDIDNHNLSLIRGSFLIPDTTMNFFVNGGNIYVSIGEPDDAENYDFLIKNINRRTLTNIYSATTPYTAINFLEQFNILNQNVYIGDTICSSSKDKLEYMRNIRAFLKEFNNFNNTNDIIIYNLDSIIYNGGVSIFISGNESIRKNNIMITNEYSIDYYYFNNNSEYLQRFINNNEIIKNTYSVGGIEGGYIIIRISDLNHNIPRTLNLNGVTIDYDTHFTQAKQQIQLVNNNIINNFHYGDILVYLQYKNNTIELAPEILAPTIPDIFPLTQQSIDTTPVIQQTKDISNTSSLSISVIPSNTKCTIYGPLNYILNFDNNINIINMIPGMYTILGDYDYLNRNNLYQNEYRILIEKNTSNNISIDFASYFNNTFIN